MKTIIIEGNLGKEFMEAHKKSKEKLKKQSEELGKLHKLSEEAFKKVSLNSQDKLIEKQLKNLYFLVL